VPDGRRLLPDLSAAFMVDLRVDRDVREHRRLTRAKRTSQEWRDRVDLIPEDTTLRDATDADYRYVAVDTTHLDVDATVRQIAAQIPEIYPAPPR
jgi:hypothetical protein